MESKGIFDIEDEVIVSEKTKDYLERIAKYAKIISVTGGIVSSIMLLATVTFLLSGDYTGFFNDGIGFFVLGIPILFILLFYNLFRFSDRLVTTIVTKNSKGMEQPFKNLRDFYRLIVLSVIAIVVFFILTGLYEELLPLFLI
ncbi:MAG: hypothetical protein LBE34_12160 [Flavobacteriaceae bacterium]|jgi:hypothetical protein|nr:hypothetical protein [Flavobacteriaceae bacterium]